MDKQRSTKHLFGIEIYFTKHKVTEINKQYIYTEGKKKRRVT